MQAPLLGTAASTYDEGQDLSNWRGGLGSMSTRPDRLSCVVRASHGRFKEQVSGQEGAISKPLTQSVKRE